MNHLTLLFFAFFLVACSPSNSYELGQEKRKAFDAKVRKEMGWLFKANPKTDALNAIKKGDYRFYAIRGHHNQSIPIYEDACAKWHEYPLLWDKAIEQAKFINGMSDGGDTYEHSKFIAIGRTYIYEYNRTLLFHLQQTGKLKCFNIPTTENKK